MSLSHLTNLLTYQTGFLPDKVLIIWLHQVCNYKFVWCSAFAQHQVEGEELKKLEQHSSENYRIITELT